MLGRPNTRFLLFGLLSRLPSGALCLEDPDGVVELDISEATAAEGLFTEGAFVLVEGEYGADEIFQVLEIGHPPSEQRVVSRKMYAHIPFTPPSLSLPIERSLQTLERNSQDSFLILSDLHLDNPKTLPSLQRILEGYEQQRLEGNAKVPVVWVLCGNFASRGWVPGEQGLGEFYKALFSQLATVLSLFPNLLSSSHFILIPGPTDPFSPTTLPAPPLASYLVKPLEKLGVRMCSNPCRIRWLAQEVVVGRDEWGGRMGRNALRIGQGDGPRKGQGEFQKFLVQSLLDQAHLCPLPQTVRPVLWEYDHSLRLYPMPTALVLADSQQPYDLTYEGCHVFNPGSFVGSGRFGWAVWWVGEGASEMSELTD